MRIRMLFATVGVVAAGLLAGCGATAVRVEAPGTGAGAFAWPEGVARRPVATYSIVARDGATGRFGVAVQSHWFSVGPIVPWAEAGVGAVATQSLVNVSYGPLGLDLMRGGKSAAEALAALVSVDSGAAYRQVAMIDAAGTVAAHTGELCIAHAGHLTGELADGTVYSVQANMMGPEGIPEAMVKSLEGSAGEEFALRLVMALDAAERAGGDIRGRQSAAVLVVAAEPTGRVWEGRLVDLRVEDHPEPVDELTRLLSLRNAYDRMNAGDVAMEHADVDGALREYGAALAIAKDSAEMRFWTAVSLATAGRVEESLPHFAAAFADTTAGADWRELLRRLPRSKLFPDDEALLKRILEYTPASDAKPSVK